MTLSELETRMTNIVNCRVKAWKTDYTDYDAPQVRELDASGAKANYLWFVREHGTYFIDLNNEKGVEFLRTIREHYPEYAEYTVTFDGSGAWNIKKTGGKSAA